MFFSKSLRVNLTRSIEINFTNVLLYSTHTRVDFTKNVYNITRGNYNTLEDEHIGYFTRLLGDRHVMMDLSDLEHYNVDWFKHFRGNSRIVLKPQTTEEVSKILTYCNENKLATCTQGGNTSVSGGSVPVFDEVVISTSLMNKIVSFDTFSGALVCQSGCVLEELDNFVLDKGFTVPIDLGAKGTCHIGGNLSTNAGGKRVIRYGNLQGNVLGLEAVKANGEVIDCLTTLKKDNTGYHLKHLFIGSEGTLGLITKVAIQCLVKPKSINLALLGLQKFDKVLTTLRQAKEQLGEIISAIEVMDYESMNLVKEKLNLISPIGEYPFYLFVETFGSNQQHDEQKLMQFLDFTLKKHYVLNGTLINDSKRYEEVWNLRERLPETFRTKDEYAFTYDISLPIKDYYTFTEEARKDLASKTNKVIGFGHLGDGNLHITIFVKEHTNELKRYIDSYLYDKVKQLNGSISAEHGLGFAKAEYLPKFKSESVYNQMIEIKRMMDPNLILNPYKVIHCD